MNIKLLSKKIEPVLKQFGVKRAGLFGSVARGEATSLSDIDLLIQIGKTASFLQILRLKTALEDVLKKRVDLVEYSVLKAERRNEILSEEVRIY
jgi:predicted nucleotidyltransferase